MLALRLGCDHKVLRTRPETSPDINSLISSLPAQFKSGELFCRIDLFLVHASPAMHEALFNVLQTFDL